MRILASAVGAWTRRDVCKRLPLLAVVPGFGAAAVSEAHVATRPIAPTKNCAEAVLDHCAAFPFEGLPVRYSDAGAPTRQILEGRIPGGEVIEVHETTLAAGKMPHPPHRHSHAEMIMVRSGTIEFQTEQAPVLVTAGGAAYCAPNELHGFKNVGVEDAVYFVMKVGGAPVCQK